MLHHDAPAWIFLAKWHQFPLATHLKCDQRPPSTVARVQHHVLLVNTWHLSSEIRRVTSVTIGIKSFDEVCWPVTHGGVCRWIARNIFQRPDSCGINQVHRHLFFSLWCREYNIAFDSGMQFAFSKQPINIHVTKMTTPCCPYCEWDRTVGFCCHNTFGTSCSHVTLGAFQNHLWALKSKSSLNFNVV